MTLVLSLCFTVSTVGRRTSTEIKMKSDERLEQNCSSGVNDVGNKKKETKAFSIKTYVRDAKEKKIKKQTEDQLNHSAELEKEHRQQIRDAAAKEKQLLEQIKVATDNEEKHLKQINDAAVKEKLLLKKIRDASEIENILLQQINDGYDKEKPHLKRSSDAIVKDAYYLMKANVERRRSMQTGEEKLRELNINDASLKTETIVNQLDTESDSARTTSEENFVQQKMIPMLLHNEPKEATESTKKPADGNLRLSCNLILDIDSNMS